MTFDVFSYETFLGRLIKTYILYSYTFDEYFEKNVRYIEHLKYFIWKIKKKKPFTSKFHTSARRRVLFRNYKFCGFVSACVSYWHRFSNFSHPEIIDFITILRTCGFVCRRALFIRFFFFFMDDKKINPSRATAALRIGIGGRRGMRPRESERYFRSGGFNDACPYTNWPPGAVWRTPPRPFRSTPSAAAAAAARPSRAAHTLRRRKSRRADRDRGEPSGF